MIDPAAFAGGTIPLQPELSDRALEQQIGEPLGLSGPMSRLRGARDGVREHGECRARARGRARLDRRRIHADRVRRCGAAARGARRREDRRAARDRAAQCRRRLARSGSCRHRSRTSWSAAGTCAWTSSTRAARTRCSPRWRARRRRWSAPGARGQKTVGAAARLHALRRAGPRDHRGAAGARAGGDRCGRDCAKPSRRSTGAVRRPIPGAAIEVLSWSVLVSTEARLPDGPRR